MKTLYLDWSGDAGFKFNQASSRFMAVACVTNSEGFSQPLANLRRDYKLGKHFHFHFTNASRLIKRPFFNALAPTAFAGVVLRVDKSTLSHQWRKMRGTELVSRLVAETASQLSSELINEAVLLVDGSRKESRLRNQMRVAVSAKLRANSASLADLVMRPAREEDGLQVADMLAGASASNHIGDNALLGYLGDKVKLIDFKE